ncbi:Hypothetical Protein FCC1311_015382 [Hondaea fermentalgiana]|uniref:Uncharacterized protein n=1 Tax=Hondaea fermentalgiana TaxID=2315210 RepID=A0A2R5G2T6_9STRA|nr:Hypothetical Protein FCC1311_015382 [Hondaea fermentalgiana]|eukprot:GBG25320.1 Hypothetical Protein FCC1311_015382 [Hondaea fermentalgiana]
MSSRAVSRLRERFNGVETRGSQLLDSLVAVLQRLETARKYQDLGLPLPGPFARPATADNSAGAGAGADHASSVVDIYAELLPKLVAALVRRAEETLEQLRFCVEELEVVWKQMQPFAATDEAAQTMTYWLGQEYWRKKQLLEAAVLVDGSHRFIDLQRAWNGPSAATSAAAAVSMVT